MVLADASGYGLTIIHILECSRRRHEMRLPLVTVAARIRANILAPTEAGWPYTVDSWRVTHRTP